MSVVYLAHDPRVDRDVAIKMLPSDVRDQPGVRRRFEREARTVAALEHPAIVPIYDFGEEDRRPYLVMRYMHGGSLADRMKTRMSLAMAARIVARIASALDEAHNRGVIHRDLKPGNILFDDRGNAFLTDFGIVKITEANDNSSATGTLVLGTPAYMSPEQALGKPLDRRTDIYALGSVLYEMLSGAPPYSGPTGMSIAMKHVVEAVPSLQLYRPDLPEEADAVLAKAMSKDVSERFESAGEMAQALNAVVRAYPQEAAFVPNDPMPVRQLPAVPMDTEEVELPKHISTNLPGQPITKRRQVITVTAVGFVVLLGGLLTTLWLTGQLRLPASTRPSPTPFRPGISFAPTYEPAPVAATAANVPEFEGTTIAAATDAASSSADPSTEVATAAPAAPDERPTSTVVDDAPTATPQRPVDGIPIARSFARLIATGGTLVNIRTGPGTTFQLFAISRGTVVTATAYTENSEGKWYQVTVEGGRSGWVSARSVTPESSADELATAELSLASNVPNAPSTPTATGPIGPIPTDGPASISATPTVALETPTPTPTTTTTVVTPTRTPTASPTVPTPTSTPPSEPLPVSPTPIP